MPVGFLLQKPSPCRLGSQHWFAVITVIARWHVDISFIDLKVQQRLPLVLLHPGEQLELGLFVVCPLFWLLDKHLLLELLQRRALKVSCIRPLISLQIKPRSDTSSVAGKKEKYHITYYWKDKWQGEKVVFSLSVLIDSQDGPVPNKTRSNDSWHLCGTLLKLMTALKYLL